MDTFDNLSLAFELKLARRRAAEAPCAARDREDSKAIASALEYDAVIDPAETRQRILKGLRAYGPVAKGQRSFVDTW